MSEASISKVQWKKFHKEAAALRATPLPTIDQVSAKVRAYLEEKREPMYSGRLGGKPGDEHRAGGPSATPRGRFATGGAR